VFRQNLKEPLTTDAGRRAIAVQLRESRYVSGRSHRRERSPTREDGLLRRHHDHAVESLRAALKSLRTRSGLTVERLRATELTLAPFLDLDVVQQLEQTEQLSPEEAIVAVVRGAAAQLDVDDMLIVDAALALGLVAESSPFRDIPDAPDVSGLYAPDLSDRRTALVASWSAVHEAVGAGRATPPPTVRTLRTELESRAFERLAERILTVSPLDVASDGTPPVVASDVTSPSSSNGTAAKIVVVGAAVMDQIFAVDHVPDPGTAVQATSYQTRPGGKGLNLAVAAARLGMETHLIAPLGDDDAGARLLAYLEDEGVHTDLVRTMPGAATPVACVLTKPDGTAASIGWMNESETTITTRDIDSMAVRSALASADAVMVTFSVAWDTIEAVLEVASTSPNKPTVLLRPSPPYEGPRFAHESLRYVDYVIGTQWELDRLLPATSASTRPDRLLTQLLLQGAGTVCIAESFGCTLRSSDLSIDISAPPIAVEEVRGARDAFAAALALRLHESDGQLEEADVRWATAAMVAPQTLGGVASSMPSRDDIDRILSLTSSGIGDRGVR
jgi:ribokinase